MARGMAVIESCDIDEDGTPVITFCLILIPEAGDTFVVQKHNLRYRTDGTQTSSQIANGVQAEVQTQMALLNITLASNKVSVQ